MKHKNNIIFIGAFFLSSYLFVGCALTGEISGYESLNIGEEVCLSCWLGQESGDFKNANIECGDRCIVVDKGYTYDDHGHQVEYVQVKFSNGTKAKFIHCAFVWSLTDEHHSCLKIWSLKRCN